MKARQAESERKPLLLIFCLPEILKRLQAPRHPVALVAAMLRNRILLTVLTAVLSSSGSSYAQSFRMEKVDSFEELSNTQITPDWGKATLTEKYFDPLKHVETEHFIIHYERSPSKIARRAEGIYEEIMEFMGNPEDKMGGKKSHIFVIPNYERWKKWSNAVAGLDWIGGVCRGNEFYFPAEDHTGKFDTKGKVLNHEMTHLVFNRIFPKHVPTWLNEGVAEYFGARENMSTVEFRAIMGRKKADWSLDQLTKVERGYNGMTGATLSSFYGEAAMLVDFLTDEHEKKLLVDLITSTMNGGTLQEAAVEIYGYESYAALEEDYRKYRRKFK
ncbi:MAG: hypothetical protein AAF649_10800 [Verrucomicrobiota bacterium]